MSEKKWKTVKVIILLGSFLAALKLIFVDYTLDEEYQIVMAYRRLNGDMLFKEMWEPHQTSAFLCVGLMWIYRAVTGTFTGVVLFLRSVTMVIQFVLAWWVYRTLARLTEKEYAFLLAALYFNIVPKNIQIPEFGNMQLWFLTVCILSVMQYFYDLEEKQVNRWYLLVAAGISLSCEVLTYPTCIILFPFFLLWIFLGSGKRRWKNCAILTAACAVCGGIWLMHVFRNVSLQEFGENISRLISYDTTHEVSGITEEKTHTYADNLALWGIWLAVTGVVSGLIGFLVRRSLKRKGKAVEGRAACLTWLVIAVMTAECVQIYYWAVQGIGYEYLQMHLLLLWLSAAVVWPWADGRRKTLFWGVMGTLAAYAGVMYISDLTFYYTLPHGALGIVFAAAVIVFALEKVMGASGKPWAYLLLVSLCLCCIFGKGYTLRGGKENNTILKVSGIMKNGPAAGILTDYIGAYIYHSNYRFYRENLDERDNVLIVVNTVMSAGTTAYLFGDYGVSHYSVIDPTYYDGRLLEYWEQYPEKRPDVIVVDCWYGVLYEPQDSWIMRYIENEFGYTRMQDGDYVRFYRK
ncbi:MAG: glycosyltransferase family 39 protein [Eubacterium sp.]|nr:glycosyltransferase family 39 protein [Eubacterium sp.]